MLRRGKPATMVLLGLGGIGVGWKLYASANRNQPPTMTAKIMFVSISSRMA